MTFLVLSKGVNSTGMNVLRLFILLSSWFISNICRATNIDIIVIKYFKLYIGDSAKHIYFYW